MHAKRFSRIFISTIVFAALAGCTAAPQPPTGPTLITGKYISQPTGPVQVVENMPINMALTADGKFALVTDVGENEALYSIRTADDAGVSHIDFSNHGSHEVFMPSGEDRVAQEKFQNANRSNGLYYGLAVSADNTIYAAQGAHQSVAVMKLDETGKLTEEQSISTPGVFAAGVALDDHNHLFVADSAVGINAALQSPGGVFIYDVTTRTQIGKYRFGSSTSNFPLGLAVRHDGTRAYVASERDGNVLILDTSNSADPQLLASIPTGARPVAVLLSADENRLFVSNSLSDTISIIDTKTNEVTATVLLRPSVARDLPGATPLGMAFSPDGKRLYAALGDMNAVAVVDPASAQLLGYIPTQWYPSSVAVAPDGKRILVANGKGRDVRIPNGVKNPNDPLRNTTYILSVIEGNVTAVDLPAGDSALAQATDEVLKENRLDQLSSQRTNPLKSIGISSGNITHVVYIIKENRTYDQIMGDVKAGNGDPSLVLFGQNITPNQHAIADRFVLLDNLYACGEVSGDGWVWSTQGMADAFVERSIPYHYSNRGMPYIYEGTDNGVPVAGTPDDDDDKPPANQPRTATMPDVAGTGKYIWSLAAQAHLSMRNYGFFLTNESDQPPDNYPTVTELRPAGHDLAGVTDIDYRRFDLNYADSDGPAMYAQATGNNAFLPPVKTYGKAQSTSRFVEWNREFQMMLQRDPSGKSVPALTMIRLPCDHTGGARSGMHTPKSQVADNDYGVGEIVQAVSNSPIWKNTAIFIIEDDAQSGIDHVDAHRTTGFVISPWIKRNSVDHTFYNTDSMLKTIELLLNLPPMSQYDAVADPIMDWDTTASNIEPYAPILPSRQVLAELNPNAKDLAANDPRLKMAQDSDAMNFTRADAAPADRLDEITWQTVKGPESKIPSRIRSAISSKDDDDDD